MATESCVVPHCGSTQGVTFLIVWEGQKRGGGSGFPEMYWVVHMELTKTKHGAALTKPPRKSISYGK